MKKTLNHTSYAISVLSYDAFYMQAKVYPLKIAFGEIILTKILITPGRGVVRRSWVENFRKMY